MKTDLEGKTYYHKVMHVTRSDVYNEYVSEVEACKISAQDFVGVDGSLRAQRRER